MAKRKKETEAPGTSLESARRRGVDIVRFTVLTLLVAGTVLGGGYGAWRFDQFLREDPRFRLKEDEPGMVQRPVTIHGAENASEAAILRAFAVDRGRSLYLLNPEERRRQLLKVEWVKDTTVRRLWPDRVEIEVVERVPVAVVPSEPVLLIDSEGHYLTPRGRVSSEYPVLSGLRERDGIEIRRDRVRRMLLLLKDLDQYKKNIIEVDVGQPESLRIVFQHEERPVTLMLGAERYLQRLQHFLDNYDTVRERLPEQPVLDLRIDDRITIAR